jgi:hypothetical protein
VEGSNSPEAQAFVILMEAAYREWAVASAMVGTGKNKSAAIRGVGRGCGCGCRCGWGWMGAAYAFSCVVSCVVGGHHRTWDN